MLELEKPPIRVKAGSLITFTGRLREAETGKPVVGAKVKILDSDIGRDDLLASGITDENGSFRIDWIARKTDVFDNTVEAYAKFEGNEHYRGSRTKHSVIEVKRSDKAESNVSTRNLC
jgi:hypothetical protein